MLYSSLNSARQNEETFETRQEANENNEERVKLARSSAIGLHALDVEHHVDFDNPETLVKHLPLYGDYMHAQQWFNRHQLESFNLKDKPTQSVWKLL